MRGRNLDQIRRANLGSILRLVHTQPSVTRSMLTQLTGLNRSTVGDLVAELVRLDLCIEQDPGGEGSVGRPSPVVLPHQRVVAITINPEIYGVRSAIVGLGGTVQARFDVEVSEIPTVSTVIEIAQASIARLRSRLLPSALVAGIGLAVPGLVDKRDGVVTFAPHLGWHDEPLAAGIAGAVEARVVIANDASLGARAESTFGAGRAASSAVYLNGGASGIGGGIIYGSQSINGFDGFAGEFGHTLVNSTGTRCYCGSVGCLQTEVQQSRLLAAAGLTPHEAGSLRRALTTGGIEVETEVRRQLTYLATAIRTIVNSLNPELLILGGFLAALHDVAGDQLAADIALTLPMMRSRIPRIVSAELGGDILHIGAADMVFEQLLTDPAGCAGEHV